MDIFDSIGARLREERRRIGLSQSDMADIAKDQGVPGATRQSQSLYEKGKRMPDAAYLAIAERVGIDVLYVIAGRRVGTPPLAPKVQALVDGYHSLSPDMQRRVLTFVLGDEAAAPTRIDQQIDGTGHQITHSGKIVNKRPK